jgi:hypothetical protein
MRSVLLGLVLSGWFASPALAQCVYVACPGSSSSSTTGSSSNSSSSTSGSSTLSQHEVTRTETVTPNTTETLVIEKVVREPAAHGGHHVQRQQHKQHAYRHGYRDGYRDGYSHRGRPIARLKKSHSRAPATSSNHRRTAPKHKRLQNSSNSSSGWLRKSQPFADTVKDRAAGYEAAAHGSAVSLSSGSQASSSSAWSSSSSMSSWSNHGGMTSWPAPAMPMQQGGMICGWSVQTITTPDGHTSPLQQTWVCQCPQGWRPPGY